MFFFVTADVYDHFGVVALFLPGGVFHHAGGGHPAPSLRRICVPRAKETGNNHVAHLWLVYVV